MKISKTIFTLLFLCIVVFALAVCLVSCAQPQEPTPGVITLSAPANLQVNERIVTWDAVENASGYLVFFLGKEYKTTECEFPLFFCDETGTLNLSVKSLGNDDNIKDSYWADVEVTLNEKIQSGYDKTGLEYTLTEDKAGYEVSRGTAKIVGTLAIPDFFNGLPVTGIANLGFYGLEKNITLESSQLQNCLNGISCDTKLTEVIFPKYLTRIGNNAFCAVVNLKEVTIPDTVTDIGVNAFNLCIRLKRVTLPKGLKIISSDCFRDTALESVELPDTLETIEDYAFYCGTETTSSQIYFGVVVPGETYHVNSSLDTLIIPDSVKEIGLSAFVGRDNLKNITISKNLTNLSNVFDETAWYESQPEGFVYIGDYLYKYKGELPQDYELDIPSSVKIVAALAFENQYNLKKVTVENGVILSSYAFKNCTGMTEAYLSEGVVVLGSIFSGCSALKEVYFEDGIELTASPFSGCTALEKITLPSGMTSLPKSFFNGMTALKSFTIPDTITQIDAGAFSRCGLESIVIPSNVKRIGKSAFAGCSSLKEIVFEDGVESIDSTCFSLCSALVSVTLPNTLKSIGDQAFMSCSSLESITVPSSVIALGSLPFYGCTNLTEIFYEGTADDWHNLIRSNNADSTHKPFSSATIYFFAETQPTTGGNYWHYDSDGNPTKWYAD